MELKHRILTREEEHQLALRYRAGDIAAGQQLIVCNQLIAAKEARKWEASGVHFEDLFQEACLGMAKALEKFDPDRGIRFMSYATHWVKAYLRLRVMQDFSLVKVGTTQAQRSLFFKVRSVASRLRAEGAPEETLVAEIARCTGTKEREVAEMLKRTSLREYSLDAPVKDDGDGASHVEYLEDTSERADSALEAWDEHLSRKAVIREALTRLDSRERFIIEKRVMAEERLTLAEVGERLGFSREYARQVEMRAIAKLRTQLAKLEAA
jgi:RNA polymerase sigma-32 factor